MRITPRNDLESTVISYYDKEMPLKKILERSQNRLAKGMLTKISNILNAAGYDGSHNPSVLLRQADPSTVRELERIANGLPAKERRKVLSKLYGQVGNGSLTVRKAIRDVMEFDTYQESLELYKKGNRALRSVSEEGMLRGEFLVQKSVGIGWQTDAPGLNRVDALLKKRWTQNDAVDFLKPMSKVVEDQLSTGMLLGEHPSKLAERVRNVEGISEVRANRMARTTVTAVSNEAHMDAYKRHGVKRYEFRAMFNERTCSACGSLDGRIFNLDDKNPGVNFPPIHPNCRCTTGAALSKEVKERLKQNAINNGHARPIRKDMTFEEWKESIGQPVKVKPKPAPAPKPTRTPKTEPFKAKDVSMESYPSAFSKTKPEAKNTKMVADYINGCEGADPNVKNLYANMSEMENVESQGVPFSVAHGKSSMVRISSNIFTGDLSEVKISYPKMRDEKDVSSVQTTLHEQMHLMDFYSREDPKKGDKWFSSSRPQMRDAFKNTSEDIGEEPMKMFSQFHSEFDAEKNRLGEIAESEADKAYEECKQGKISYQEYNTRRTKILADYQKEVDDFGRSWGGGGVGHLEDIYDALSGGKYLSKGTVKYGHGVRYYANESDRIHETVANYASLSVTRPDLVEVLRKDKPELCKALDETIEEMNRKWELKPKTSD